LIASASSSLQQHLLNLHGPLVYLAVGGLVFIEVGIVIGFFIPGEIATILGGVVASQHHANLEVMVIVVATAAVLGNFSGYALGKLVGPWLVSHRPLRGRKEVVQTQGLVSRRGGPAVLIGRWIAVVRALVPGIAGLSGMDLRVFGIFSIVGGVAWGTMWVLIGYAAGLSYTKIVNAFGEWSLVALGAAVVVLAGVFLWRRSHRSRKAGQTGRTGQTGQTGQAGQP
jgi:membrane-associated protein